ncbi:MAG: hypothetical protein GXP35_12750 [Actinobacteria bacterium]|nr:hypothetical protein [Actinomycetota bacterium]
MAAAISVVVLVGAGCSTNSVKTPEEPREVLSGTVIVQIDEFPEAVTRLAEGYDTPPGGRVRPETIEASIIAEQSLESIVAFRVACQWFQYWLDTRVLGDGEAEATARTSLEGLSDWPIVQRDGLVPFYAPLISAMIDGDDAAIEYHLDVNCPDVRLELPGD